MQERIPSTPPQIAPVPSGTERTVWSVMIPVYNCSQYLEQTLNSVLIQAQGEDRMQIEVVDDCSTDADVSALVSRVGRGRVQYFRKEVNMGSVRNFETCINRARGKFVHILHGDDFISPGFYEQIEKLFDQYPDAGAAFSDFYYVDSSNNILYTDGKVMEQAGVFKDALLHLGTKQRIQSPSMVVKRSVYEALGSFFAVKYGEDWEMWVRIAAHYPILHTPEYLANYRVHDSNISSNSLVSGQNIRDINKVMEIISGYLPEDKRDEIIKQAKKNFGIYYAWMSHKIYHEYKDRNGARTQIKGALNMSKNRTSLYLALKLYAKLLLRYKQ